jgi:menaquinone-dependent protoporphyrinogen oxidase
MNDRVLIAYATKYGATAEIADKIGQVLTEAGFDVEVLPADLVHDVTPYGAVVLGSGVYVGQWRKEAVDLLKSHEEVLAQRPVWLFSSGPTGKGDPVELMKGWRFPEALAPNADRIGVRDKALFHGAIDIKRLSLPEKLLIKGIKAPIDDYRDWDAITAWAAGIAAAL